MEKKNRQQHRMGGTRFYGIWKGMQGRCYCKSNKAFIGYGLNGITSAWKDNFLGFKKDMYKSYLEHVDLYGEKDTTIERKDPKGNYSKDNCLWATRLEQANNRTDTMFFIYKGKKKSVRNWAREKGLEYGTLRRRIVVGWPEDNIFDGLYVNQFDSPSN